MNKKGGKVKKMLPEDTGSVIRFLNAFLDKSTKLVQHLDTQINILIGTSSAIFLFASSQSFGQSQFLNQHFIIITIASGLSAFIALFAIHPPRFMRKRGQAESVLYNKKISSLKSFKEFKSQVVDLTTNKDAMIEQYSIEIYNLAKYYYKPKRMLFHLSRNILMIGIVIYLLSFIINI